MKNRKKSLVLASAASAAIVATLFVWPFSLAECGVTIDTCAPTQTEADAQLIPQGGGRKYYCVRGVEGRRFMKVHNPEVAPLKKGAACGVRYEQQNVNGPYAATSHDCDSTMTAVNDSACPTTPPPSE